MNEEWYNDRIQRERDADVVCPPNQHAIDGIFDVHLGATLRCVAAKTARWVPLALGCKGPHVCAVLAGPARIVG